MALQNPYNVYQYDMRKLIYTLSSIFCFTLGAASLGWSISPQKSSDAHERDANVSALDEWKSLAEQGELDAQMHLATLYREGKDVPQDYKAAVKWFTLAADQGDVVAQYNLGIMHSFGLGTIADYNASVRWYKLAAEQGNPTAQYNLGRLYYLGQGVSENLVYAHMWAHHSSSNGFKMGDALKELLTELMTPNEVKEAQLLTIECLEKNYKGC